MNVRNSGLIRHAQPMQRACMNQRPRLICFGLNLPKYITCKTVHSYAHCPLCHRDIVMNSTAESRGLSPATQQLVWSTVMSSYHKLRRWLRKSW
jgi:hypothetical protein